MYLVKIMGCSWLRYSITGSRDRDALRCRSALHYGIELKLEMALCMIE